MNRRGVGESKPSDKHERGLHGELEDVEKATALVVEHFSRARSLKHPENQNRKLGFPQDYPSRQIGA
jgi:hypothetical protein